MSRSRRARSGGSGRPDRGEVFVTMSMISGLLLNLLLWAVAAAVFTAAVCWAVVEWFPGGAAGRSEEPADAGPAPERPEEPRAGRGDGQVDRKAA